MNDLEGIDRLGVDRAAVAERGARSFLEQVLIHGFFHGDPTRATCSSGKTAPSSFLDFGLVGRLDDELLRQIADLFLAIIARDAERVVNVLIRIGVAERTVDRRVLTADMEAPHRPVLRQVAAADRSGAHHCRKLRAGPAPPGAAADGLRTAGQSPPHDGEHRQTAVPGFQRAHAWRSLSPRSSFSGAGARPTVSRRVSREVLDMAEVIIGMPRKMDGMMDHVRAGQLEIKFRHQGLENLIHRLDIVGNRLAAGIIIAALVIGSSLVMQTGRGPFLWGFPLLGIAGFAVAGLIGMWLVFSILRSGRI